MASASLADFLCSLTADDLQFGSATQGPTPKFVEYLIARDEEGKPLSVEEYDAAFKAVTAQAYPEDPAKAAACYVLLKKIGKGNTTEMRREFLRSQFSHIDGADEMLSELNPQTGRFAAIFMKREGPPEVFQSMHLSLQEALFVLSALEDGLDASMAKAMEGEPFLANTRRIGGEKLEAVRQKALAAQ